MGPRRLPLLASLLLAACAGPAGRAGGDAVDLLVFAPHPDDETLGCAGILHQTLKRGARVKVVLFTHGDGFPALASLVARKPVAGLAERDFIDLARFRQLQTRKAIEALGGTADDLVFLGYPDSGLEQVYRTRGPEPFRQRFTGKSETYGALHPDYHGAAHGRPAPYTHASVLADVSELIERLRPRRICVTHEADRHADHRAAFLFVRDAAEKTGFRGELDAYLIHGGPEWPWPARPSPELPFEAHEVRGARIPQGVLWPPSRRVPLRATEAEAKQAAIRAHASHLDGATEAALRDEKTYLESFVKSEEVFWTVERR